MTIFFLHPSYFCLRARRYAALLILYLAAFSACDAVGATTATVQQTRTVITHRKWHGIDEATVFQPFSAADYDTIAVENFDITGVRLPPADAKTIAAVQQAMNEMKPEFIAGLTKKVRGRVSGQQPGKTLVVRARVAKLDPGSQAALYWSGFLTGTVQIQIIGELIDGSTGQLLVRFAQERQSGVGAFGAGSGALFRRTARQIGGDVATLINAFTR
jgi:hypothetical protein